MTSGARLDGRATPFPAASADDLQQTSECQLRPFETHAVAQKSSPNSFFKSSSSGMAVRSSGSSGANVTRAS